MPLFANNFHCYFNSCLECQNIIQSTQNGRYPIDAQSTSRIMQARAKLYNMRFCLICNDCMSIFKAKIYTTKRDAGLSFIGNNTR
jgi:hypothetical protein